MTRPYRRWTDADECELRRLWASPLLTKEICARFGRHRNSLLAKVRLLGLPHRIKARTDAYPVSTFDEWWAKEKARMRQAKMAAPTPNYHGQFGRVLARSLHD